MKFIFSFLLSGFLLVASPVLAMPEDKEVESLKVSGFAYPTIVMSRPGIAFLEIENLADQDISLISADSPEIAGTIEIHTHVEQDGIMKMKSLESLEIEKGKKYNFKDNDVHLMLMGMQKELKTGVKVPTFLKFRKPDGSEFEITTELEVIDR